MIEPSSWKRRGYGSKKVQRKGGFFLRSRHSFLFRKERGMGVNFPLIGELYLKKEKLPSRGKEKEDPRPPGGEAAQKRGRGKGLNCQGEGETMTPI